MWSPHQVLCFGTFGTLPCKRRPRHGQWRQRSRMAKCRVSTLGGPAVDRRRCSRPASCWQTSTSSAAKLGALSSPPLLCNASPKQPISTEVGSHANSSSNQTLLVVLLASGVVDFCGNLSKVFDGVWRLFSIGFVSLVVRCETILSKIQLKHSMTLVTKQQNSVAKFRPT